jgi:hypothetical protein
MGGNNFKRGGAPIQWQIKGKALRILLRSAGRNCCRLRAYPSGDYMGNSGLWEIGERVGLH